MSAMIWCECVCSNCGGVIGYYYKNSDTIKKLKAETANWKRINGEDVCEDCAKLSKRNEINYFK